MNVITEVDETTQRRDSARMDIALQVQTEEAETPATYKAELQVWTERAFAYLCFFIILQITSLCSLSFDIALIPLFAFDLKIILSSFCSPTRESYSKLVFSKKIIHQQCSLAFKIIVLVHNNFPIFSSVFLIIPLIIAFLNQFLNKVSKSQECKYLVWLIMAISECVFLLTVLNVTLRLENIVNWEPSGLLWPVFIGLCLCGVLLVGLVLFTLGSFISWASEEIPLSEFLSSFWLLFTLLGAILSIISLCIKMINPSSNKLSKYYCVVPIIYLVFFVAVTQGYISRISQWWVGFFDTNTDVESIDLPMPQQRPQASVRPLNFHSRVSNTMKKVPHVLMRISSSYFRPVETPKNLNKGRTLSLNCNFDETCVQHKRNLSNPLKIEVFSPSAKSNIDRLCEMCCERLCNAVIMDCGHGGICYECSLEMWKAVGYCHMCRGGISQVLQVEKCKDKLFKVHSTTSAVYCEQEHE